jgi:hypothetical protein
MWFDGPCPFLLCLEEGGHSHPICPECEAIRYGNISCKSCRAHHGIPEPEIVIFLTSGERL